MPKRAPTVPRWLQRGEPEPYVGAFRDFVLSIDEVPCCPVATAELRALRHALDSPAGLCALCGEQGVWRHAHALDGAAYTPPGCTRTHVPRVYLDLCGVCAQAPDRDARLAAAAGLRRTAAWN